MEIQSVGIVGAGQITLSDLTALEDRPVDIRFYQILSVQAALVKATVRLSDFPVFE